MRKLDGMSGAGPSVRPARNGQSITAKMFCKLTSRCCGLAIHCKGRCVLSSLMEAGHTRSGAPSCTDASVSSALVTVRDEQSRRLHVHLGFTDTPSQTYGLCGAAVPAGCLVSRRAGICELQLHGRAQAQCQSDLMQVTSRKG